MRAPVLALALAACGGGSPPPEKPVSPAPTPAAATDEVPAGIAPPAFTAAKLREGLPVGTVMRYSMQPGGKPAYQESWTVTAADATTVTMATETIHEDGRTETSPGKPTEWTALAKHGHFPADRTRIYEAQTETPAGSFATRVYEVTDPSGIVSTYYFALHLPGPPVRLEVQEGAARVLTMVLVARESPRR